MAIKNSSEEEPQKYSAAQRADPARVLVVPAELGGQRLDQVLAQLLPEHSRNRLQGWVREGAVLLDGVQVDPKRKVWGGESLRICAPAPAETGADQAENIPLDIVFEDQALLVINKPAGLVVHPGSGNWSGTLLNALLHHAPELARVPRAGIVHRLDKDTSGLLVVGRTLAAQTALVRQLQSRSVRRHYFALVHGRLVSNSGTVDEPIARHPVHRTRMAVVPSGKPAVTHFQARECFEHCTLVECRLETGRTHQIRVHMAHLGHPLVGDELYGRRRRHPAAEFARQALHAFRLGLVHPDSGQPCEWEVPLAADFEALLTGLRAS